MRIPLDYYRILGLPIQATAEQLQQAHRDRVRQLPRREYSEVAIAARKQLIDEAYTILSDPEQRQAYDASFLAKTYELDNIEIEKGTAASSTEEAQVESHSPSIEIDDKQFVGALLILQELGEYELVLKLSQPYLGSGRFALKLGRFGEPQLVGPDIILTVALSCLELGREQWQQGQYENAAATLETGQELLLQEGLFANVRGEILTDLYKLRPYRILELLSKSEENVAERRKGLQLLRDMFQERGGIEGSGDDQSGLNVDDFLRFIQQLRCYLTAAEQQQLFEAEARRPSAVATYLAAYAYIASGFAYRQPALIRKAKQLLMRLGKRQDVHLEQAICALLLGQTEEASQALELSQEYETLEMIREQSQGAPDLLPGLCQYTERWLAEEVYPHFRDLAYKKSSLKDYFADKQVQAYLERLPAEDEEATNQWVPVQSQITQTPKLEQKDVAEWEPVAAIGSRTALSANISLTGVSKQSAAVQHSNPGAAASGAAATNPGSTLANTEPPSAPWEAKRTGSEKTRQQPAMTLGPLSANATSRKATAATEAGSSLKVERPHSARRPSLPLSAPAREERLNRRAVRKSERSSARLRRSLKVERLIGVVVLLLLALFALLFVSAKIFGLIAESLKRMSGPTLLAEQPSVRLDSPPLPIPEPTPDPLTSPGPISEAIAQQVIQKWLSTKSEAMGANHAIERLPEILTGSALSKWEQWAKELKQENSYYKYKHNLKVKSVDIGDTPERAKVEAEVNELAELYKGGRMIDSRNDILQVRYDLVRQNGQWRIQNWDILR
ncbi:MAG: IMS domain-containing protein [Oscillatoriaceae bacterium SKW80]|nr:IMS domain-containing protein [Oscillatoriaceae bacterium SKYG93]MCX8122394.1 IMS domain-containing protein [Oscillatoriaceae bacterium SKW80]MDW8452681.1 IMS domain-containing protein [Oscillatoriaceae cyanobacterium SKYGB_i_bin93]HIK27994.1 DUF4101 domain-containing protein [Oscillatoriaceae cyanobacterium M7585_C2015_266]